MRMLNRLGWAEGITLEAYDLRIGIRISEMGLCDRVRPSIPYGAAEIPNCEVDHLFSILVSPGTRFLDAESMNCIIYSDVRPIARVTGFGAVANVLEDTLELLIGEFARERIFVHAGVIGWRGKAALFPGPSFVGKSRLVAALIAAGAQFYSDEYAVLDSDGQVHPFARPLSIREDDAQCGQPVRAEEIGRGGTGTEPIPVGLVVFSTFEEGASWDARRLSPGEATLKLLKNTLPARRRPQEALQSLGVVAERAVALEVVRGEAENAAARILDLMDRQAGASRFT
jgi:hypothetical protein